MNIPKSAANEKGQSLVEFAVSAAVLLLLLGWAVDLGRMFLTMVTLQDAAQEGAAYASYDPDNIANIQTFVRSSSNGPIDLSSAALTITPTYTGAHCAGNEVLVSVAYTFDFTMPLINVVIGSSSVPLTARSRATVLYPTCP